jgi:CDGSH-type Zn-finger protein
MRRTPFSNNLNTHSKLHHIKSLPQNKAANMTSEKQKPSKNQPKVKVTKNGPYVVSGGIPICEQVITTDPQGTPIEWTQRIKYPAKETCTLCRCGHSENKPFCDGSHAKIGFDGTETANQETYLNKPDEIEGPNLKLTDVQELCASARFCHRAGGIWNLIPQSNDPEAKRIACEEAGDCPSGRLVVLDKKREEIVEPKFEKSLSLVEDPAMGVSGPIWVRGGVPVESAEGKTYKIRNRVTLCRCGKSQNKPFCDSSHYPDEHEPHEG